MISGLLAVLWEVQFESRSRKLLCSSPSEISCLYLAWAGWRWWVPQRLNLMLSYLLRSWCGFTNTIVPLFLIYSFYSYSETYVGFFSVFTEKHELQPNDLAISKSLESSSRMFVYRKDLTDSLVRIGIVYFPFFACLTPSQNLSIPLRGLFQCRIYFLLP